MPDTRREAMLGRAALLGRRDQDRLSALVDRTALAQSAPAEQVLRLPISGLTFDSTIQVRAGVSKAVVRSYAEVLRNGGQMPPIVVYRDADDTLWVADGWHRCEAYKLLGWDEIDAEVRAGSREDAREYAEEANLTHGQPLSAKEKFGVFAQRILRGHVWVEGDSNSAIGRVLGVSAKTITNWRARVAEEYPTNPHAQRSYMVVAADGRQMDTRRLREARQAADPRDRLKRAVLHHLEAAAHGLEELGFVDDAQQLREYARGLADAF